MNALAGLDVTKDGLSTGSKFEPGAPTKLKGSPQTYARVGRDGSVPLGHARVLAEYFGSVWLSKIVLQDAISLEAILH